MGCVSSVTGRTIRDGEAYAVSNRSGNVQVVEGPAWKSRCGNFFEQLKVVVASEDEYLIVKFRDGRTEYRAGPSSVVQHPVDHISVSLEPAMKLNEQEVIVVYRKPEAAAGAVGGATQVRRELVRGPGIYIPRSASEWVHEFQWTGASNEGGRIDQGAPKRIGALRFKKLRTCPGKTYVDVDSVRTSDNALLTVKLMIFFRYSNVEQMLDNTNDAFADIINAVSADVIEWTAPKKFEDFLGATDHLNKMDLYSQLRTGAAKIGMEIEKVVFRGYDAPHSLQSLHDRAIEKRTALALAKESEEEEQRLADFKLKREAERSEQQARLEMGRCNHDIEMKNKTAQAENERKKMENAVEIERLKELKALDKNMEVGKYLIAKECQLPPVVQCATMMTGSGTGKTEEPSSALSWLKI